MSNSGALTRSVMSGEIESPAHAFRSNISKPIQFWKVSARGESTQPALCKYSCLQASGNDLTDVENYFNFFQGHTWDWNYNDGSPQEYKQTDTLDANTFEPLTAVVDIDTAGTFPNPPPWNNLSGYDIIAGLVGSGVDWDKAGTRAGIIGALNGVDWASLWNGSTSVNSEFKYDRIQIGFNEQGFLPFTGGTRPFGNNPCTGNLIGFFGGFGPSLELTGTVGAIPDAFSISDNLGVSLSRTQIQIRNYRGTPIPYFIFEEADVAGNVTVLGGNTQRVNSSIVLGDTNVYYRKVSEGNWTSNYQIIQLPDAAMDGPQAITAPLGTRVRNGTSIGMVVGMTFDAWMLSILGASWADHVFS